MEKKFRLTDETKRYYGKTLYQIEALKDFGDVKAGDLGGWVETENNLSHKGDCWIYGDAKVCENAKVFGNAKVYDSALVCDSAAVFGDAKVYGNAQVYGDAVVRGSAEIYDSALVCGNAEVCGDAQVYGDAVVRGDAVVQSNSDYIVFKNWWSSGRYFTWMRSINKWSVGCFFGTGEELVEKAYGDSKLSGREYQRVVNYVQDILGLPHISQNKNV